MNRRVFFLLIFVVMITTLWLHSCKHTQTTAPSSAATVITKEMPAISKVDMTSTWLKNAGFRIPASKIPIKNDVVLSAEKTSEDVSDIKLVVVAYGKGNKIDTMHCMWLAFASNTKDGKGAGLSMGEWKGIVCDLMPGKNAVSEDWINRCMTLWFSEPTGGTVIQDINIGELRYEFSGSEKSASMDIQISSNK